MNDEMEDLQDAHPGAGTFQFGPTKKSCNHRIALVLAGKKRAASAPLVEFEGDMEALPQAGRRDIAVDWDGEPKLIIRTKRVEQVRFCDVTAKMALSEGEDETLDAWKARQQAAFEKAEIFDPEMIIVFEHFELFEDLSDRY